MEGAWLADAEQVAHQQTQVEPRDVHQQAFRIVAYPRKCVRRMPPVSHTCKETAFNQFAALS